MKVYATPYSDGIHFFKDSEWDIKVSEDNWWITFTDRNEPDSTHTCPTNEVYILESTSDISVNSP